ncbi:MAG: NADP-dependent oxidoreductase [Rhodobacterales bacterium 65-51]|uniref:NADP-dependent oxidoreductase n=1 Tax=uncultured Gemmobacter sp. TaxID=1095917 RepID=UPI00095A58B6|nr:NADP-dependent oxidoreductase [uncultured Gemmobacter sp.]OJY30080.1 MAG: NADP-dependent oxidoreductase [Rhodobacterales bacterium 65-51]
MTTNPTWVLKRFPSAMPVPEDFEVDHRPAPVAGAGELCVRTLWLSVDPYMRARLSPAKNYAAGQKIGEMMQGGGVGEVITSDSPQFRPGDIIQADDFGWQPVTVVKAATATRLDPSVAPVQTSLGCLGMPGLSAYFALLHVGQPKAGETVLISAASGAVGQIAGQIARIKGLDPVAIAGSDAKLDWCRTIGYRTGINHRTAGDLTEAIAQACPKGVDVFMDNTAGPIHDAALLNLNTFGRIVVVGTVARADKFDQPDIGPRFLRRILVTRARIQGFLLDDFEAHYAEARQQLTEWYRQGLLEAREDVAEGIEAAPHALIRILKGENFGKQLVRV